MNDYQYDNQTVKLFIFSSIVWGVIGILAGVWVSIQMWNPAFQIPPYFTFGRLRVVHTNILAFGLVLGTLMGMFYYIAMRLCKIPLIFPKLARLTLYLFNIGIFLGLVTLLSGKTQALEYAEFEWPIDIAIVILWVIFAAVIFGTIIKRKEQQMYISLWFMIATIIVIAVIYVVNNLSIPVGLLKSYHLFAGLNSANVQWWYGHNAVGAELTMAVLALFYYFLPKSTGLPIYSHRLSIVAFWSLVFAYMWTGAHHLVYSPIPDWIQTTAIAFTLFLIAPSWGSVVNGYYTISSDWSKMRTNYLTKFFLLAIVFYGLQTLQGPIQGLRTVNQLVKYTDWVPGHVHMGVMGWDTLVLVAAIYYVIPKLYRTEIYSVKIANTHFWLVVIGQLIFSITMWVAGIQQGVMWQATSPDGSLMYTFSESVAASIPFWQMRTLGGIIFTVGMLFFIYNIYMTVRKAKKPATVSLEVQEVKA